MHPAPKEEKIWLNLGCGHKHLPHPWVNVDLIAKGQDPDINADVRDLHMIPDNHADIVAAFHVIEHFYRWEVPGILEEWRRVLKPGGQIILECPDIRKVLFHMVNNNNDPSYTMWALYGNPWHKDPAMCHRWGYTPAMLRILMENAEFVDIEEQPAQTHMKEARDMRMVGYKNGN